MLKLELKITTSATKLQNKVDIKNKIQIENKCTYLLLQSIQALMRFYEKYVRKQT